MKLTCLNKGDGFQYPPCHLLNLCGFRILIDCPLDLSAMTIFSPVPYVADSHAAVENLDYPSDASLDTNPSARKRQRIEKQPSFSDLVCAEPWYKTVKGLHLWDISFIDIVLISNPMGMLGLPFLTQNPKFSAKIYMTESTAKLGELMMKDLVSTHMEFKQIYGPSDSSFPWWIKQLEVEDTPQLLKNIVFGENDDELGCWMPLYSFDDMKDCVKKIEAVKFAEEVCYNGTLVIKALSSGLDIGTCNWLINGPKGSVSYVSGSIFVSQHTMSFDFHGLKGSDIMLYSDFSCIHSNENTVICSSHADPIDSDKNYEDLAGSLLQHDESLEEMEKLDFICSCAIDSANAGGSTLISISRIGSVLQLLELMAMSLESLSQRVPIYVISSVVEELLAYTNTIPEWVCQHRQEKFLSGEVLFAHTKLIKDKMIHLFPSIHSPDLVAGWQEPCIIIAPLWNFRLGPSVHILRRWCRDPKALLVLEDGIATDMALLPFKPIAMKVLQCSFLSGIKLQKVHSLLTILQPKMVLFPDVISQRIIFPELKSYSVLNYSENQTLCVVSDTADGTEVNITMDLASRLRWIKLRCENSNMARLKGGQVVMDHGKHRLVAELDEEDGSMQARRVRRWGSVVPETLLNELTEMGMKGSIEQITGGNGSEDIISVILINCPESALVEITETATVLTTDDEKLASVISQAVDGILDAI